MIIQNYKDFLTKYMFLKLFSIFIYYGIALIILKLLGTLEPPLIFQPQPLKGIIIILCITYILFFHIIATCIILKPLLKKGKIQLDSVDLKSGAIEAHILSLLVGFSVLFLIEAAIYKKAVIENALTEKELQNMKEPNYREIRMNRVKNVTILFNIFLLLFSITATFGYSYHEKIPLSEAMKPIIITISLIQIPCLSYILPAFSQNKIIENGKKYVVKINIEKTKKHLNSKQILSNTNNLFLIILYPLYRLLYLIDKFPKDRIYCYYMNEMGNNIEIRSQILSAVLIEYLLNKNIETLDLYIMNGKFVIDTSTIEYMYNSELKRV